MSEKSSKDLSIAIKLDKLGYTLEQATKSLEQFKDLAKGSEELREFAIDQITRFALSIRASKLDKDELESFFKYPYCIIPGRKEHEHFLIIPKFVDAHFGWLHKVTASHNIFLVNPYVDWLGDLPQALKKELKIPDALDVFLDGEYLVGKDTKKIQDKFRGFIKKVEKDGTLLIDKSRHFELLANLIKEGILPFIPKPIDREDLVQKRCDFKLRDYQEEAWKTLKKYSNIGVFFPPSTGKTWLGMYVVTHIKGCHLITVPSTVLIEQWQERIEQYTDLRIGTWNNTMERKRVFLRIEKGEIDVVITTYQSAIKYCSALSWDCLLVDEVHHMPANLFSKMATFSRKYFVGLSATPQREDGREEFIFALSGKPIGLSWGNFKKLGIISNPPLHVWIVKNERKRLEILERLLDQDQRTIIFCDSIQMGKDVSKKFQIPHIHGETKEKYSKILDAKTAVVSRVGDEGVSIPDIERVIEISWLHGSRRQELQRFTRLLHGKSQNGEGHIIMTGQEYINDKKRLFGIMDKGFKIVLHREGIAEKVVSFDKTLDKKARVYRKVQSTPKISPEEKPDKELEFEMNHPILSLPGIQKRMSSLNKAERNVVRVLFQKEGQEFSKEGLAVLVGFTTADSMRHAVNFPKLEKLQLIQLVGHGKLKADLTLMGIKK